MEKSADKWQLELRENVDYVALYHINDYFVEEFSSVFEKPEDIYENGVYCVDKDTGRLSLYQN